MTAAVVADSDTLVLKWTPWATAYVIEFNEDLMSGVWTPVTGPIGAPTSSVPILDTRTGYYRVRELL